MSILEKIFYRTKNDYDDRRRDTNGILRSITVQLNSIESMLLLFDSTEASVLLNIFIHLADFIRFGTSNIDVLKNANVLDLLLAKDFYRNFDNYLVKRLALLLASRLIESTDTLKELKFDTVRGIVNSCVNFYLDDIDDFCIEFITVILNKCLVDPRISKNILLDNEFIDKFFNVISNTYNSRTTLNSIELLHKMLTIQREADLRKFTAHSIFPINRLLCEMANENIEIRVATLNVINIVMREMTGDVTETSPFNNEPRIVYTLSKLIRLFTEDKMLPDNAKIVIDVLANALRSEFVVILFFELNFFRIFVARLNNKSMPSNIKYYALSVLSEIAAYPRYLEHVAQVEYTEKFLSCFLDDDIPETSIILGLNRLMKAPSASKYIIQSYERGLLDKILKYMPDAGVKIRIREQLTEFLKQLLDGNYHKTAEDILTMEFSSLAGDIFSQPFEKLSIAFCLTLMSIIENLAQNSNYRQLMGETVTLTEGLIYLLMNPSSTSDVLSSNIFRCLSCLVDEPNVRNTLLEMYIFSHIKRCLKSTANLLKTSVTNFIIQTTRFPEYLQYYIRKGVLEVLIFNQKYAFCVPTWSSAIDSILSKSPTLKFCIRNQLDFTDITAGQDFYASKIKYDDFRNFRAMLDEEVSPLQPILLMSFDRFNDLTKYVIHIPNDAFSSSELDSTDKPCYYRRSGDPNLQKYVTQINDIFIKHGVLGDTAKRCVDFSSLVKRAKLLAEFIADKMGTDLKILDIHANDEYNGNVIENHLKMLASKCHTTIIPVGAIRSGGYFERALLFKGLADQVGLPCTLQRSTDNCILFNELPLPVPPDSDKHCDNDSLLFMPWRMLRPTHIIDLMYNVGELYPLQSRQALQYLRLF